MIAKKFCTYWECFSHNICRIFFKHIILNILFHKLFNINGHFLKKSFSPIFSMIHIIIYYVFGTKVLLQICSHHYALVHTVVLIATLIRASHRQMFCNNTSSLSYSLWVLTLWVTDKKHCWRSIFRTEFIMEETQTICHWGFKTNCSNSSRKNS